MLCSKIAMFRVSKLRGYPGPAIATFVPQTHTKSETTNLPNGVVHVFRDVEQQKLAETNEGTSMPDASRSMLENADSDGHVLGVLTVPSWMTSSDVLAFVAPAQEGMAHLRMIRITASNRSIALIKFRNVESALEFAEAYHGKAFSPHHQPTTCHIVHITSTNIVDADDSLPTCPVCLERMDSAVTGLVTVPCSHTFHCECLSKWGDGRCPVCHYLQNLPVLAPPQFPLPIHPRLPSQSCADCNSTTSLWICLICGNIRCGRYGRAHTHAHYKHTTHVNKADGKLVKLPSAPMLSVDDSGAGGPRASYSLTAEKIEAIGIEYSYLLTSLDSQWSFYEEQTIALHAEVASLKDAIVELRQEAESSRAVAAMAEEARRQQKFERFAELARSLKKELFEERAESSGLSAEEGETERAELEDQVRDIMFFLEARTKIEAGEGEMAEVAGGISRRRHLPVDRRRR
ncbi:zf-UBP-domain-containing protein [Russula emetica]|nr:zf-UBP-domain-containing protein [Russula emetica]